MFSSFDRQFLCGVVVNNLRHAVKRRAILTQNILLFGLCQLHVHKPLVTPVGKRKERGQLRYKFPQATIDKGIWLLICYMNVEHAEYIKKKFPSAFGTVCNKKQNIWLNNCFKTPVICNWNDHNLSASCLREYGISNALVLKLLLLFTYYLLLKFSKAILWWNAVSISSS